MVKGNRTGHSENQKIPKHVKPSSRHSLQKPVAGKLQPKSNVQIVLS